MKKSVLIVGGSIAGLTSALVLASAKNAELDFDITIVDDGKADLSAVAIYNVPFFPKGVQGKEIIEHTKKQIETLIKVNYVQASVEEISGSKGAFVAKSNNGEFKADYVILATGASRFDIKGLGDIVKPHELMNKPNKIRLATSGRQMVKDGIYASGLASGVTTMVTCAIGSAGEAACAVLSDIKGAVSIVHDTPTSR
ncbi:NAD(P)/FAD-dependent oxidoreductase [Campylobacter sp. MIT 99-7217]|uniref:NAD(P)/FAD-dependent oxidoreductase n=1 Tax=Campylobacter sp. MIT 99-7217 TaxID=535091 RepID=UPI00115BA0F0|nr:NAD(P)/FAD-dependent oxidoreductase [Campylobacter sp. MIT 99-7217]TQR33735.1 NAD(P)/FAD-dependent oxidoreductase [Campylobacter sp. MIT 99-7217]